MIVSKAKRLPSSKRPLTA